MGDLDLPGIDLSRSQRKTEKNYCHPDISALHFYIYFFSSIFISIPINLYSSTHIVRGDHEGDNDPLCSKSEIFLRYAPKFNIYVYFICSRLGMATD